MNLDFAKIVSKTIPTDVDYEYECSHMIGYQKAFDEELELLNDKLSNIYLDNRVRVCVLINNSSKYVDDNGESKGVYYVFTYYYSPEIGFCASVADGPLKELNDLTLEGVVKEAVIGDKDLFETRGSSVATGVMKKKEL